MTTLCVLYPNQLSLALSCLREIVSGDTQILMCETKQECTHVKHHKKKLVFILSAMRHFAALLRQQGYDVIYVQLDDLHNSGTLTGEIRRHLAPAVNRVILTEPGDFYQQSDLLELQKSLSIPLDILPDDRFLCSKEDFAKWAAHRKELRMEYFYRTMRKRYNILLNKGLPEGGKWNYDKENRKFPKGGLVVPPRTRFSQDKITQEVIQLVTRQFADHFGDIEPFDYAVTHEQAQQALSDFIAQRLPYFGDYQDAMLQNEPWVFHADLSHYINIGLLCPLACIRAAEKAYYAHQVPLQSAEGFIRQILGWREYVRGIYWLTMPHYRTQNFFNASRALPEFYWTGETDMNCLKQCVLSTKKHAYAHHIQRLMVLGNFALLTGIDPKFVNEWFWIVYADAYEWVELPNVTGMALFADGGLLGSKPYAASGAYINKMSNYCSQCRYNVKLKEGSEACPFNYLYWNFLIQHENLLAQNHRLQFIYAHIVQMSADQREKILNDAKQFLDKLELASYQD